MGPIFSSFAMRHLKEGIRLIIFITAIFSLTACTSQKTAPPFDPRKCVEEIPAKVKGLSIVSGPRSKKSIIRDMVPVVCNGHVLYNRMASQGMAINKGTILFRVLVEYNGEVQKVVIEETTIQSKVFLQEVSDFISDTDFVFWGGNDEETVFLYPMTFGD